MAGDYKSGISQKSKKKIELITYFVSHRLKLQNK